MPDITITKVVLPDPAMKLGAGAAVALNVETDAFYRENM